MLCKIIMYILSMFSKGNQNFNTRIEISICNRELC